MPRHILEVSDDTTDGELFDLLRPYGPLVSVAARGMIRDRTGYVVFWLEEDARAAEKNTCENLGGRRHKKLQVFNPYYLRCKVSHHLNGYLLLLTCDA